MKDQIETLLSLNGFALERQTRHIVWRHADGRSWTMPSTPGDSHALRNNLSDLKNYLKRGRVTGAFGLTEVSKSELSAFELTLHPHRQTVAKPIKERARGISIERYKKLQAPPTPTPPPPTASSPTPDAYEIGREFQQVMQNGLMEGLELSMTDHRDFVETHFRRGVAEAIAEFGDDGYSDYVEGCIEKEMRRATEESENNLVMVCRAATRVVQKNVRHIQNGETVSGKKFLAGLATKIDTFPWCVYETSFLAEFAVGVAVIVLSDVPLMIRIRDGVMMVNQDGAEITPVDAWDQVGGLERICGSPFFQ